MAAPLRHTPLGLPVVPDVNVILRVSGGMGTAVPGRRSSTRASGPTGSGIAGAVGQ